MRAEDARPGDVVLDSAGTCWQRGGGAVRWSTFSGPVTYYGPWLPEYGPQGMLVLLARDGRPAVAAS